MWYLAMSTAQRPVVPVGRPVSVQRLVTALGTLMAGRFTPVSH